MKKKKKVAAGPRGMKYENTQNNENASNGKRDFDDKICFEEKMKETTRPWWKKKKKVWHGFGCLDTKYHITTKTQPPLKNKVDAATHTTNTWRIKHHR